MVTGLCSLLLAQDINRTPNDIRSILRDTAEDQVGNVSEDVLGFDIYYGYGRVNAHQALLLSNLSTNEFTNPLKFSILPNPVSNFVTINSNLEFNTVLIHNILGIEILRIENSSRLNSLRIDLTNFDKGVYLTSLLNKKKIGNFNITLHTLHSRHNEKSRVCFRPVGWGQYCGWPARHRAG